MPDRKFEPDTPEPCYNRFARYYDLWLAPLEALMIRRWRRRLLAQVQGPRVLELAIGTGLNLPYYPREIDLVGVDISKVMMKIAAQRAKELGVSVQLQEGNVQRLPFPDESFDTIVSTFLFCNIDDPRSGLREAGRVCKPGGRVLLLEHVRPSGILGRTADRLNAWTSTRFCNEHINRRTLEMLPEAGLKPVSVENHIGGIVKLVAAEK